MWVDPLSFIVGLAFAISASMLAGYVIGSLSR